MSDREMLKAALATTPECLTPEQLESFLDGKHSNPHLAQCTRCQSELAMLKSFETGAPLPDEGAAVAWISSHLDRQLDAIKNPSHASLRSRRAAQDSEGQGSWWSRLLGVGGMRWALPVAALTAVAIAAGVMLYSPKAPELQANVGGQTAIYRSQEVQVLDPVGDVQQVPRQLRWQGFAGATAYKVVVMEVDHSQLWAAETQETEVEIPVSVRTQMLPGKPILWQVTALDSRSQVKASSQVQRFALASGQLPKDPSSSQ